MNINITELKGAVLNIGRTNSDRWNQEDCHYLLRFYE